MKKIKHITHEAMLEMFSGESLKSVKRLAKLPTAKALVLFENRNKESQEFGKRTVVAVGPSLTHTSVEELKGSWIFDGDRKQDAVAFCVVNI